MMFAFFGVWNLGVIFASAPGKTPARAKAYDILVDTLVPALPLARVELMIAKNTRIQNKPNMF